MIKGLFLQKTENTFTELEKVRLVLVAMFGLFLPFDMFYTTLTLYLIAVVSMLDFSISRLKDTPKTFWIFWGVILLSILGYSYSNDVFRASYLIERQLAIIIFPILIPLAIGRVNAKKIDFIALFFVISCVYTVIYLLLNSFYTLISTGVPLGYLFTFSFFNHNFGAPLGIHATYLSLFYLLSIIFLISKFNYSNKKSYNLFLLLAILSLFVGIFFLQSRNSIISFLLIIAVVLPIFKVKNRKRYFIIFSLLFIGIVFLAGQSNYVKKRFTSEIVGDISLKHKYSLRNPEPRMMRWQCAWDLIKQRPLLGYGTGDEIRLLKEQYLKRKMMVSYREEFNTHNQYLSILLKNGVVGLLLFLGMLFYFFRLAIRTKDLVYFSFLFILSVGFFTENFLDANKGIFYFAFFNTLLGYNAYYANKTNRTIQTA